MKLGLQFVLAVALAAMISGNLSSQALGADQMPWVSDLATAQRIAASRGHLVLIHFWADSCPPCRRLEKNVFSERTFAHGVGVNYVPVKINVGNQPDLAERFQVKAWPTDVIITPTGHEVHRMISPQSLSEYAMSLRQIAWRYQAAGRQDVAVASFPLQAPKNTAPMHQPMLGTKQQSDVYLARTRPDQRSVNATAQGNESRSPADPQANWFEQPQTGLGRSAAASGNQFSTADDSTADGSTVIPADYHQDRATANQAVNAGGAACDPTCNSPTCGQNCVDPSPAAAADPASPQSTNMIVNSFATQSHPVITSAAATTAVTQPNAPSQPNAPAQQNVVANPYVRPHAVVDRDAFVPTGGSPGQPATQGNATARPATTIGHPPQVPQPNLAGPTPVQPVSDDSLTHGRSSPASFQKPVPLKMPEISLAMEGYCPVTLIDENAWVKGDKQWGARHRGRVFLFHSLAAQQKFLADPERYSPLLVGYDPVAFSKVGLYVEGKREHGIRFKNQIVLFSSEETLQQFSSGPETYLESVFQAMHRPATLTR